MFKRVRWVSMGAAVGFGGSLWARRRVRRTVDRYLPDRVGSEAIQRVRYLRDDVIDALYEGRTAMRAREVELRSQLGVVAETRHLESARPGRQRRRRRRPASGE